MASIDPDFPCSLCAPTDLVLEPLLTRTSVISIPLPTHRLASIALQALAVDAELSPLVKRRFSLTSLQDAPGETDGYINTDAASIEQDKILRTEYRATTNRMLRVAVNGFMESLGVVLQVMQELDVDVLRLQEEV